MSIRKTEEIDVTALATRDRAREMMADRKRGHGCRRCGEPTDWQVRYVLSGNYIASVCDACREASHDLDTAPEFVVMRAATARLAAAQILITGKAGEIHEEEATQRLVQLQNEADSATTTARRVMVAWLDAGPAATGAPSGASNADRL